LFISEGAVMAEPLKILMIASEAIPFAKSGGLADVVPSLARYLSARGHDVRIILPRYYFIDRTLLERHPVRLEIRMGNSMYSTAVDIGYVPSSQVPVYFVDHESLFGRDGIYGSPSEGDYHDNALRFALLCKAAFALCRALHWIPDILHGHDWPSAPAFGYLATVERSGPFEKTAGVFTIHNVGYQGSFPANQFELLDLPWSEFRMGSFEFYDSLNFMQGALRNAQKITTVSPGYAKEIITSQFGYGMEGILQERQSDLVGILNGMDYNIWNPATDDHLPQRYDVGNMAGKARTKAFLQQHVGLETNPEMPVFGIISRLVSQKGFVELVAPRHGILSKLLSDFPLQIVMLGTGERWCEDELVRLAKIHPRLRVQFAYNERLSHLIQAGADFFLMPSLYEPCGLTQMYALRYGTIPVVSPTGGLADTVVDVRLHPEAATGIYIEHPVHPDTIHYAIKMAMYYWTDRRNTLETMRERGMKKRFDWARSSVDYEAVFRQAIAAKRAK
jgi:starch synthase